ARAKPRMKRRQLRSQRLGSHLGNERDRRRKRDPRLQCVRKLRERGRPGTLSLAPASLAPAKIERDRRIKPSQSTNNSEHRHPGQRPRKPAKNECRREAERRKARRRNAAAVRFDEAPKRVIASGMLCTGDAGP